MKIIQKSILLGFLLTLFALSGCGGGLETPPPTGKATFSEMTLQDALDEPLIDRRTTFLSTLGPPDSFSKMSEDIGGKLVISEQWSYIELGVRFDMVDGEIAYVVPIDNTANEIAIYPHFYDPAEFDLPMAKSDVIEILKDQTLSTFDLADADISDGEMIIGDQIMLGFVNDQLVYVETLVLSPDTEGDFGQLFIEDDTAATKPAVSTNSVTNRASTARQKSTVFDAIIPPEVKLIGNFFRLFRSHSQRNRVYREANQVQAHYQEYIQKLEQKAKELEGSCRLSTLSRRSNAAALIRVKEKLAQELAAANFITETEKREARSRFIRNTRTQLIDALVNSGIGNRIVTKLRESGKIQESLGDIQDVIDGVLDPGGFQQKITERISKLGKIGQAIGGPIGARLRLLVSQLQRTVPGVANTQDAAIKVQDMLVEVQSTLDQVEQTLSGDISTSSPAYLMGNIEQLIGTLDAPDADAISAAIAKYLEPGLARNLAISNGLLDPLQLKTMMQRVRGSILQAKNQNLIDDTRAACGRPAGESYRSLIGGIAPQKPANSTTNSLSTTNISGREIQQQIGFDNAPIPVCAGLPVDFEKIKEETLAAIESNNFSTNLSGSDTGCDSVESNSAPIAFAQKITLNQDERKSITLSAVDTDNDPLTFNVVSLPANGKLTGVAPNYSYTPNSEFSGSDSFTFKANDGKEYSNIATVNISVIIPEVKEYVLFKRSGNGFRKNWGGYASSIKGYDYFYLYIFPSQAEEMRAAYSKFDEATANACANGPALCPCGPTPDIWQTGSLEVIDSFKSLDQLDPYRCDNFHYGPSNLICNMWELKTDPKYWDNIIGICD